MGLKAVKKNLSIGKALQIIEVMAAGGGPMRLQDIAAKVSQPPSTSLRFLNTLMDYGYADQREDNLQYFLTMKFCRIGDLVCRQVKIRDVVRPYLEELARTVEESTTLSIQQNANVVFIDVVEGPDHLLQTLIRIGKLAPLHCTAAGKCFLMNFEEAQISKVIDQKGIPALTKYTLQTKTALLAEVAKIRKNGYSEENEECEIGVRSVAAPVYDYSGRVIAAISTTGPLNRMTADKLKTVRGEIMKAAEEISKKLGYVK